MKLYQWDLTAKGMFIFKALISYLKSSHGDETYVFRAGSSVC